MSQRLSLILVVLIIGTFLIAGCASNRAAQRRSLYVDDHPELSEQMAEAILDGQIMVGMTGEMVQVAWGTPVRTETIDEGEFAEIWVYGNYFVGGTITSLFFDEDQLLVRYEVQDQSTHSTNSSLTVEKSGDDVKVGSDGSLERRTSGSH